MFEHVSKMCLLSSSMKMQIETKTGRREMTLYVSQPVRNRSGLIEVQQFRTVHVCKRPQHAAAPHTLRFHAISDV